jgi:hypothetical protein
MSDTYRNSPDDLTYRERMEQALERRARESHLHPLHHCPDCDADHAALVARVSPFVRRALAGELPANAIGGQS